MASARGKSRRPAHHESHARPDARRRPRPSDASEENKFAEAKLAQIGQLAAAFTWSPWKEGDTRTQHVQTRQDGTDRDDETQLERWRLRGDMLRIATFYRVTGAKRRAERRTRRERAKTRFRQWAMTVLRDQRQQGADGDAQQGQRTTGKRRAEGEPSYREARPYKQRATPAEMQRRRLRLRRTRLVNQPLESGVGV